MPTILKNYIFIVVFLVCQIVCLAQSTKKISRLFEKSKQAYFAGDEELAIKYSKQVIEMDSLFIHAHLLLADIYNGRDCLEDEVFHLKYALLDSSSLTNQILFRLGDAYFKDGMYQQALEVFNKALMSETISRKRKSQISDRIERCRFAIEAINNPVSGRASKLSDGVNSTNDEYWPSISIAGDKLVFTRLLMAGGGRLKQEDAFYSEKNENGWGEAKPFNEINSPDNEGTLSLSGDGRLLFFTACNRPDGKGSCDIYFSRFKEGEWTKPQNAGTPVNSGAWESQPSVSANADYLYFASNRKGGKGKKDIWRCPIYGFNASGFPQWGMPENLGDSINTSGDELSPYIHFNGENLYFSSDHWIGLGGTDIFVSTLKNDSTWQTPKNLGYPINTGKNEQGFVVDARGRVAYFASNQDGNMDLYSTELVEKYRPLPVTYLKGKVLDEENGLPLQTTISLIGLGNRKPFTIESGVGGEFLLCLPLGENYAFNVSKQGYLFYSQSFELKDIKELGDPVSMDILLKPVKSGAILVLRNIYFNTGSHELLPESFAELGKLKTFLTNNEEIFVEIKGHTDDVGSQEYNLQLSGERAKAVFNYLVKSGIEKERLLFKGYGFSQPFSENTTEQGRKLNRRTEVEILGIKKPPQK